MPYDQQQFLDVVDLDEAQRRFRGAIELAPLGREIVPIDSALGRIVADDVRAHVNVPSFDRSNYDGYAVHAADTFGASEQQPRRVRLLTQQAAAGVVTSTVVEPGRTMPIATGGMLPRGADAIVMVEHTDVDGDELVVMRSVVPGFGVTFAATDICAGETILRAGDMLTARETGVAAAVGLSTLPVWRRPKVAIFSTGDEIIEPGTPMQPGRVYDSNARILADSVRELGAEPIVLGIVADELGPLRDKLAEAIAAADMVLLSGGTSKGAGDVCYRAVGEWTDPGVVVHGVALRPGKPICLAVTGGKPVVVLPGFPTSAVFTFHQFVAPILRIYGGRDEPAPELLEARLAVKVNSQIGRTEYLLVSLVQGDDAIAAFPMPGGSGSVTTFSRADGFLTVDRHRELLEAGENVRVQLLGQNLPLADLVIIGSHCVGLDVLVGLLSGEGVRCKVLAVGSTAGLAAARRGECDVAPIHLLDLATGTYNRPFLDDSLRLVPGYRRRQGIVHRRGDVRFDTRDPCEALAAALADRDCMMINRNAGSGTRILVDALLGDAQPRGHALPARTHHAVAAAVAQHRADWGVAIETVATAADLGFIPLADEHFDFAIPVSRSRRPAVRAFCERLTHPSTRSQLTQLGFRFPGDNDRPGSTGT